jgi:divalent metal cation (Fe/Co/Zn/Cd) transporter
MTMRYKPAVIPEDLHKWLNHLRVENGTRLQDEIEKALREAYQHRQAVAATQDHRQPQPVQA